MSGVLQVHIDHISQSIIERPREAVAIAAGSALILGFLGGSWYTKYVTEKRASPLGNSNLKESVNFESEASTPRVSVSGTPRQSLNELGDKLDYSMALLYRADLQLGQGRFATLCSQATLGQFKKLWRAKSEDLKLWERGNAVKFCLQVTDEGQLLEIEQAARQLGLPTFTVKDSGNNKRVRAVMALGPAQSDRIHNLTHTLKLLS